MSRAVGVVRVDRLGLEPTIPFLKHLGFPLVLSHSVASSSQEAETPFGRVSVVRAGFWKQVFGEIARSKRSGRLSATAVPVRAFKTHYAQEGLIISKCVCMEVKRYGLALWPSPAWNDRVIVRTVL